MGTARYCPYCRNSDGYRVALTPMPVESLCMWLCEKCETKFDLVPEPTAEERMEEAVEAAEERLGLSRLYGASLYTGRDAFLDSGELENRKRR